MSCINIQLEPRLKKRFVSGAMRIRENTEMLNQLYGHLENPEHIKTSYRAEGGCDYQSCLGIKYVEKSNRMDRKNATLGTMLLRGQGKNVIHD